ncbi:MAG: tannase/feruloyl esterase family alpha/beta hydrolase [Rhodoferax sp.]|nr:tannase/feruloyl esterase family alpha/beta hydrolase [Rhodoferax sp.]
MPANGGADGVVQPAYGNVVSGGATTNALMQGLPCSPATQATPWNFPGRGVWSAATCLAWTPGAAGLRLRSQWCAGPHGKQLHCHGYGRAPKTSYMMGCSNGGRHAMVAASRYADHFDGLIAGNPGFNLPKAAVQHAWDIQAFSAVNPDIKASFPPADMKLVADKVLEKCDALDGLADGMVNNPPRLPEGL